MSSLKKEATDTKEWRKTKDKSDESRDAKVSALAGELATLAANEKSHFDKLESMLGQVLQGNQSAARPGPIHTKPEWTLQTMQSERPRIP